MADDIRVGIVGCGRATERLYVPTLPLVPTGKVVGVVDPREDRRQLIGGAFNDCAGYETVEEMLDKADVNAVVIATPPNSHVAVVRQALAAGAWALVEKPLASTLEDAEALQGDGEEAIRRVMVGYNRRFWSPVQQMRDVVGRLATPRDAIKVNGEFSIDVSGWGSLTGPVDPLDDLASHYLDLFRYIFNTEISFVEAARPTEKSVKLKIILECGTEISIDHVHGTSTVEYLVVEAGSQRYALRMGSQRITPAAGPVRQGLDTVDRFKRKLTGSGWTLGDSYRQQFESFFGYIIRNEAPSPGVGDGIAGIRAVEAARRSAANNGSREAL